MRRLGQRPQKTFQAVIVPGPDDYTSDYAAELQSLGFKNRRIVGGFELMDIPEDCLSMDDALCPTNFKKNGPLFCKFNPSANGMPIGVSYQTNAREKLATAGHARFQDEFDPIFTMDHAA